MLERKRLVSTLWILFSGLALLVAVFLAPIRTSGFVTVSSRPDCLRRNFALPLGTSTSRLSAVVIPEVALEENALSLEDEEQDWVDPLHEPLVSFLPLSSFRKLPDRQSITPPTLLSHYPLRC